VQPRVLDSLAGRSVAGALMIVVASVAEGLITLWPSKSADLGRLAIGNTRLADVEQVQRRGCPQSPQTLCQLITARLRSGPDRGTSTRLSLPESATSPQVDAGDAIRVARNELVPGAKPPPGAQAYSFADFERRSPLYLLAAGFAVVVVALARWKGARSLVGLGVSLLVVTQFMVPAILGGSAPVLVALTGALAVMLVTVGFSHGLGVTSIAAVLGATASLLVTAGLAVLVVHAASITGLASEEVGFLLAGRDPAAPPLSLEGLVLAGIVVGALGVLDDVTVSQASTVMALRRAAPRHGFRQLFRAALAVGRDHLSATVNTLVLAYVGAALPVLLIFEKAGTSFGDALNREVVATEVAAMLVGSIGLVLAVPLTTALAAWLAIRVPEAALPDEPIHHH
jgi:uncharacterized membrane protein